MQTGPGTVISRVAYRAAVLSLMELSQAGKDAKVLEFESNNLATAMLYLDTEQRRKLLNVATALEVPRLSVIIPPTLVPEPDPESPPPLPVNDNEIRGLARRFLNAPPAFFARILEAIIPHRSEGTADVLRKAAEELRKAKGPRVQQQTSSSSPPPPSPPPSPCK